MTTLPKAYDPKLTEEKWYAFWEQAGFFSADPHSKKPPYSIVIPPPNVTGALHMGHALVDTIQDVLIRYHRMKGFETLWVPGTDHAGIATQGVVEKMLFAKTGKRRKDFSREEFLQHVWDWKEKSEGQILGQIKKLGCSCDWSRLRFTMDEGCNRAVRVAFKKMFDQGLIYRGDYLVNWDPVTQTALSDDEVEHEEVSSFLWHIRYPLEDGSHIVVATTRPETMLGDTAVAVHPEDARYKKYIGKSVLLPLTDRKIPVIADPFVEKEFGSGAVKITPAHDFNDFETGLRHHLPKINILTPDARINENGGEFSGLSVEEARIRVVAALKEKGLIEKIEPYALRVGVSYRSKAVLQPYLSKQWFVKMSVFKNQLLDAVRSKKVELVPEHWESTYTHWIENLRDWCISRQLWWGHRIPVWYHTQTSEILCYEGEGMPPEVAQNPELWVQDADVLDTWFSSALWPLSTLGWPAKTEDLRKFYPTSVLVTAHDILFFWVARMIMMGEYFHHEVPFKQTFLHGLIYGKSYWKTGHDGSSLYVTGEEKTKYDLGAPLPNGVFSKWEKMSKTKGNVIDPIAMIESFGTDAVRFALCFSTTHARQIDLDQRRFEEFKNFANKIWNGARFVLMHLESLSAEDIGEGIDFQECKLEDFWVLSALERAGAEVIEGFAKYAFDKASSQAYAFFWNDFCSVYVEICKPYLFEKMGTKAEKIHKQKMLLVLLTHAVLLLHPIAPFITEEIFQNIKERFPKLKHFKDRYMQTVSRALDAPACIVAPFPEFDGKVHAEKEKSFAFVLECVRVIRNIRMEMQIPPQEKTELYISGEVSSSEYALLQETQNILLALTPVSRIVFAIPARDLFGSGAMVPPLTLFLPIPESLKAKEKNRLQKEEEKLLKQLQGAEQKLQNEEFRSRAPEAVVKNLEQTLLHTKEELAAIAKKLSLM